MTHTYTNLPKFSANCEPLSPVDFIVRTAEVYGDRLSIVHGQIRRNWAQTFERCKQLANALKNAGIQRGDTVAVMLPNIPAMIEAHFSVPMLGAVLNTLNTRLDLATITFMLRHGEARALIIDTEYIELANHLRETFPEIVIISVHDLDGSATEINGATDYEAFLASGSPIFDWHAPPDEWDAIALNYTSGTTGNPKGVVYHHRGAYLNAISNILEWDLCKHPVYLWTLPLFHCNGWCFAWTIAARAGVNVCLRKFDARIVFDLIRIEKVTHYCGAPIVQSALADAPEAWRHGISHTIHTMVAGAAPAPTIIAKMKQIGFKLTHVYGLTEVYGPAAVCAYQEKWDQLSDEQNARLTARQGVRYHLQAGLSIRHPDTLEPVPADETTVGEIMFRGNVCMKGYLKNEEATKEAFRGGWFHTGDLGVLTPDGYVRIKDRSKDIIISGGENISSVEVEDAIYRYPGVAAVAVVAMPDARWGEVPCAFIEMRPDSAVSTDEIIAHCRQILPGYKVPKTVHFGELPKTATGKIQKFELREKVGSTGAIDFSKDGS